MRVVAMVAAVSAVVAPARAARPVDVPAKHWAARSVEACLAARLLDAPSGKFGGASTVTRMELVLALRRLAVVLESGARIAPAPPVRGPKPRANWRTRPVNRYVLASALHRIGGWATVGLPRTGSKGFVSGAVPQAARVTGVSKASPAYAAIVYLARRRMVWSGSPLLKPGKQPVTAEQLSTALGQLVSGVTASLVDEPQNRPDLGTEGPNRR